MQLGEAGDGLQHRSDVGIPMAVDSAHVGCDCVDAYKAHIADLTDGIPEDVEVIAKVEGFFLSVFDHSTLEHVHLFKIGAGGLGPWPDCVGDAVLGT